MGLWKKLATQGALYGLAPKKKNRKRIAKKKEIVQKQRYVASKAKGDFYDSREWKEVRYRALKLYSAKCVVCNRDRSDGLKLHVDHIIPRSKAPHLSLEITNLQIMCEDCNLGKGNKDRIDWRPPG